MVEVRQRHASENTTTNPITTVTGPVTAAVHAGTVR